MPKSTEVSEAELLQLLRKIARDMTKHLTGRAISGVFADESSLELVIELDQVAYLRLDLVERNIRFYTAKPS